MFLCRFVFLSLLQYCMFEVGGRVETLLLCSAVVHLLSLQLIE